MIMEIWNRPKISKIIARDEKVSISLVFWANPVTQKRVFKDTHRICPDMQQQDAAVLVAVAAAVTPARVAFFDSW